MQQQAEQMPTIPLLTALGTYFGYGIMIFFGYLRDFWRVFRPTQKSQKPVSRRSMIRLIFDGQGYAPLVKDFEDFFTRRMFARVNDCWGRPITSCPGAWIDVVERKWISLHEQPRPTGKILHCLNVGSYNYLGFGDPDSPTKSEVFKAVEQYSAASCSPRNVLGTTTLHRVAEETMARYIGKEDAIVLGMGFGTNAAGIPSLIGKGGLIVSDERNHASIVVGARTSGAVVRVFKHNDTEDLEAVLRRAIVEGQPLTHRPWTKILIMIEGIYSMEGELPPLAEIVRIKKKYRCYLYIDEAHSIGALGRSGKGVCDQLGVDVADVDILMGTFTKSFGSVGGYLAGDRELISYIRQISYGSVYAAPLSPPACQQIVSALRIMMGEDGTNIGREKLRRLRENSNLFRLRMKQMGAHVLGDWDSPICPVVLYSPGKVPIFSRECLKRNLAVVVVGYPATPLMGARSRFCISAAHTKEDVEKTLAIVADILDLVGGIFDRPRKVHVPAGLLLPPGTVIDAK